MLVGGVVQDKLGDHPQSPAVGFPQEEFEIPHRPVGGVNVRVAGDVVPVVLQGRRVEGEEPDGGDPQILQVIQLLRKALEISDPVPVAVEERLHVEFIDDGVLVPEGIVLQGEDVFLSPSHPALLYRK